jgi:hypothetical protein
MIIVQVCASYMLRINIGSEEYLNKQAEIGHIRHTISINIASEEGGNNRKGAIRSVRGILEAAVAGDHSDPRLGKCGGDWRQLPVETAR